MTITTAAYPMLVGYSFGLLASLALIAAFLKRHKFKEDGFLIAALGALAALFAIGIVVTREQLQGHENVQWVYLTIAARLLFAGFAVHDATRVVHSIGRGRLSEKDVKSTRYAPFSWYIFAFTTIVFSFFDLKPENFPVASFAGILGSSLGLLRLIKVLRPQSPPPNAFFNRWSAEPAESLISLNLSPTSAATLTPLISDVEASNLASLRWIAVFATAEMFFDQILSKYHYSMTLATIRLVSSLALLPCFFGLIQYHARALFFDVVLKRGILVTALALTWAIAMPLALPARIAPDLLALFALTAAGVSLAWIWTYSKGDAWLDRLIFHRPDYVKTRESITAGMTECSTEEELSDYVTSHLAEALRAGWVEFRPTIDKPASAAVKIASGDRVFGYLLCGPRYRAQPYRSEDVQFLETIGAHFGGSLQSFETQKMEELAARSELRALRAQINPHFLFNALNTLADMAQASPEAEKAILNLSRVFRFALDSTRRETVPLREEIALIRAYLEIERARFESKLQFSIDVPDRLLEHPVPPMLMQPLVENAIKHGVSRKIDGGWVRVTATPSKRGMMINVEDNGVGFNPAELKPNIGLSNVRQRVEALGGSWRVDSTPGRGTSIAFEVVDPSEGVAA